MSERKERDEAMKKIMNIFQNMRIREKLIYSHIFIALIPFLLIGALGIRLSLQEAEKNADQHTSQLITQVGQTLDIYINGIEKAANTMIGVVQSTGLTDLEKTDEKLWGEGSHRIDGMMEILADTHKEIAGILFAFENDRYISVGMSRISRDSFQEEKWYQVACDKPDEAHIISSVTGRNIETDDVYSTDEVFSVVKAVRNPKTGEVAGVLLFDVSHTMIQAAVKDAIIGTDGFVFVLDSENRMVYTPQNKIVYRIKPEWLTDENHAVVARILQNSYHIRYKTSQYTGWKIVSVASYQEVMRDVRRMIGLYMMILVLVLALVFVIVIRISDTITKPIVELRNLMKKTEGGNLTVRFQGDGEDEVSQLGRKFNRMLERIQELLNRVYEEEESKRQIQLKVVQEQFKPHFLYNTLDTINWMARDHGAMDVVQLVDALTNVFRISLSKGKDYISLEEEMKYISNYLYIQKIRYGQKVTYEIQAEEFCMKAEVPKLILQPLVENAIYHGVKLKRGKGHLKVWIRREGKQIAMSVCDDGRGMDRETAAKIRGILEGSVKAEENGSFGLYYVQERLRLKYQNEYSIQVESGENVGTEITLRIPGEDGDA